MATYYMLREDKDSRFFNSPNYNYVFNKSNGFFARWGNTKNDDPSYSPFGPEILDLEISKGSCLGGCKFCYKCNGHDSFTQHMDIITYTNILDKMPKTLTQIAFGITDIYANPDFFEMMLNAKCRGIIPNYTTHGLDVDKTAARLTASYCGAVAVSIVNKKKSFDAIRLYHKSGCKQINIHFMLSMETYSNAAELLREIANTPDLKKAVRAVVFLHYKPKGRNPESYSPISEIVMYQNLMKICEGLEIAYGFDSCSAPMYLKSENDINKHIFAEPCESTLFSSYINSEGKFFPCSFAEGEGEWTEGIDVVNCNDFLTDVWFNDKVKTWREKLIGSSSNCKCSYSASCRNCPIYDITPCRKIA